MPRETETKKASENAASADPDDTILRARFEFDSAEFVDDGLRYQGEHEYDRTGTDQGLVLIFNQEKFDDESLQQRHGSISDVNNLITTFRMLGFNVKKENIYQDLDRNQIFDTISKLNAEDCENKNSLIVVFMSHGNAQNVLYTRNGQITVKELIGPLDEYFKGKPKLFIIQACKSTEEDMLKNQETQLVFPIYDLPSSVVVYYSTVEGKVSVRHVIRGTWVIEELCKSFLMYGRKEDVLSLLQRTTKCICTLQTELSCGISYKQMPVIISTLEKKFYLTSNKYRKNVHVVTQGIIEVSGELQKLLQRISKG